MYKDSSGAGNLVLPVSKIDAMANTCNGCKICKKECTFLSEYGNPGAIAGNYKADPEKWQNISFECSLCGLCKSVCPMDLDPEAMFLDFRQKAVKNDQVDLSGYKSLLNYEKKGTSKKYTLYQFPDNCDTVFFPGCALAGTRPGTTLKTYEYLKKHNDSMGIVLDCCSKPSHDLGRQDHFNKMLEQMKSYLLENGIKTIIVACPSCNKTFNTYAKEFNVQTVYEIISQNGLDDTKAVSGKITVHDPCPVRFENSIHDSVRSIVKSCGLDVIDTPHTKSKTFCCGEGAGVGCVSPGFARGWAKKRANEASPHKIATYCAGCVNLLSERADTFHVLDLMFEPEKTMAGKAKVSKAPFTYLNRLQLKNQLKKKQKNLSAGIVRENKKNTGLKLVYISLLIAAIAGLKAAGIQEYLDQEKLSQLIQAKGNFGPLIYMLIYAIAPSLFLPGLPITIAGGVLFGPFWGVIYAITGATTGAGIAFFFSRYICSGFVESKLVGPNWIKLTDSVEKHGWKVVALTRLIPLFPFNLLNYAFGLTRIKFSHYIITTFICMLPVCIAYIVFSSSLPDLLQGNFSGKFFIGIGLIVMVSLIPVIYNKIKQRRLS